MTQFKQTMISIGAVFSALSLSGCNENIPSDHYIVQRLAGCTQIFKTDKLEPTISVSYNSNALNLRSIGLAQTYLYRCSTGEVLQVTDYPQGFDNPKNEKDKARRIVVRQGAEGDMDYFGIPSEYKLP